MDIGGDQYLLVQDKLVIVDQHSRRGSCDRTGHRMMGVRERPACKRRRLAEGNLAAPALFASPDDEVCERVESGKGSQG